MTLAYLKVVQESIKAVKHQSLLLDRAVSKELGFRNKVLFFKIFLLVVFARIHIKLSETSILLLWFESGEKRSRFPCRREQAIMFVRFSSTAAKCHCFFSCQV